MADQTVTNQTDGIPGVVASREQRNDVFISYSRKDQEFVKMLEAAFNQSGRDPWVDWNDIQKGEEWWQAIQRGIEGSHTFVFVLSPDSVASRVCQDEVNYAAECHKRFLPIVRREGFDYQQLHPKITSHNWLFFRENDDFNAAFQELLKAIDTDLDYIRIHTRLLIRAIEWQNKRRNESYLLRGIDLEESKEWFMHCVGKEPKPTELQAHYINASHNAKTTQIKKRQQAKWIVILTTVLVNAALVAGACYSYYQMTIQATLDRVHDKLTNALKVGQIGINGDRFAALATLISTEGSLPLSNPLYQEHQTWLCQVHQVFPNAILRTYVQGSDPLQIRWVGDLSRDLKTTCPSTQEVPIYTQFGQPYLAKHDELEVYRGKLITPITPAYKDDLGNWISIAGAIQDTSGRVVGGIKVNFKEDYVETQKRQVLPSLVGAYILIFIWLTVLSLIILRVTHIKNDPSQ